MAKRAYGMQVTSRRKRMSFGTLCDFTPGTRTVADKAIGQSVFSWRTKHDSATHTIWRNL
jgi:hypothetical protein